MLTLTKGSTETMTAGGAGAESCKIDEVLSTSVKQDGVIIAQPSIPAGTQQVMSTTASRATPTSSSGIVLTLPNKPLPDISLKRAERLQLKRQFRQLIVSMKNHDEDEDGQREDPTECSSRTLPDGCDDEEFMEMLIEEYARFLRLRLWVAGSSPQKQHPIVSPSLSCSSPRAPHSAAGTTTATSASENDDMILSSPPGKIPSMIQPVPSYLIDLIWKAHMQVRNGHEYDRFCSRYDQEQQNHFSDRHNDNDNYSRQGLYNSTLQLYEQAFKESPSSKIYNREESDDEDEAEDDDTSNERSHVRGISIWPSGVDDRPYASSFTSRGGWESEVDEQGSARFAPTSHASAKDGIRKNLVLGSDDSYSNDLSDDGGKDSDYAPSDGGKESGDEDDGCSVGRKSTKNRSPNVRLPRGSKVWVGSNIANLVDDWIEGDEFAEIQWDGYRNGSESVQTSEIAPVVNDQNGECSQRGSHSLRRRPVIGKKGEKVWIRQGQMQQAKKALLTREWCKGDQTVSVTWESLQDGHPEDVSSEEVQVCKTEGGSSPSGRRRTVSLSSVEGRVKGHKSPAPIRSIRPHSKVGKVLKVERFDLQDAEHYETAGTEKRNDTDERTTEEKLKDVHLHRSILLDRVKLCKDAAERRLHLGSCSEDSNTEDRQVFGIEDGYRLEDEYLAEDHGFPASMFPFEDDQFMCRACDSADNLSSDAETKELDSIASIGGRGPKEKSRLIRGSLPGERRGKVLLNTPRRIDVADETKSGNYSSGRTSRVRRPTWKATLGVDLSVVDKSDRSVRSLSVDDTNESLVNLRSGGAGIRTSKRIPSSRMDNKPILMDNDALLRINAAAKKKKQKKRPASSLGSNKAETVRNVRPKTDQSVLPSPLYQEGDEEELTEYQCLLRKELVLFEASRDDVIASRSPGRNGMIEEGRVGLRCRHCSENGVDIKKTKGHVYYTASIQGIYQVAQNMGRIHLLDRCPYIPKHVRRELEKARCCVGKKMARVKPNGGKKYWSDAIKAMGCYEKDGGVWCRKQGDAKPLDTDRRRTSSSVNKEKSAPSGTSPSEDIYSTMDLADAFSLPPLAVPGSDDTKSDLAAVAASIEVAPSEVVSSRGACDVSVAEAADVTASTRPRFQCQTKSSGESGDVFGTMETYNDAFAGGLSFMDHGPEIESLSGDAVDESFFAKDFDDWAEINHVSAFHGRMDLFSAQGANDARGNEGYHPPLPSAFARSIGDEGSYHEPFSHQVTGNDMTYHSELGGLEFGGALTTAGSVGASVVSPSLFLAPKRN